MTVQVQQAVDFLVSSYGDIRAQARQFVLDPADVASALSAVDKGTAEEVVLTLLAECNPVVDVPVVKKAKVSADSTD